jgi:hypothetical protein
MAEGFNGKIASTLVILSGLESFPPRRRRSGRESVVPPVNCLLTRPVYASVCRGFPGHPAG